MKDDNNYKSPYAEYIAILPENTNDFPVSYSEEEMSLLEGSELKKLVESRRQGF